MSRNVVLFGPPGCGKGTQAVRLAEEWSVPHVSTGDMFRDHRSRGTEIGKQVDAILDRGDLVPDSITDSMMKERLAEDDVEEGVILDGYPRNVAQAKKLESILDDLGRSLDAVVVIRVPENELVRRIVARGMGSGRPDDIDDTTIRNRLMVYHQQTQPCIEYFESRKGVDVHHIDGVGTVDEVTRRILAAFDG